MSRSPRPLLFATGLLVAASSGSRAATVEYGLDLPAHQRLSYQVEFEVAYPGRVTIEADWSPTRVLVFRVAGAGDQAFRLAGPPPERIEIEVDADEIVADRPWLLTISGLPSREPAQGRLTIELPDSPDAAPAAEAVEPPAAEVESPPWRLAARAAPGVGRNRQQLHEAIERFRQRVVDSGVADAYRWQDGALRYLAGMREAPAANATLQKSTRTMLERVADAVQRLDDLRFADTSPLGKAPTDPLSRRAWDNVRDPRFVPIADELDALMGELHRGHAPRLERELWFTNFLSCLIVCERHFEQRARLGADRASNTELVSAQWQSVLLVADALDALRADR